MLSLEGPLSAVPRGTTQCCPYNLMYVYNCGAFVDQQYIRYSLHVCQRSSASIQYANTSGIVVVWGKVFVI